MPDSTRGSIYISTADEIGETLVDKLGGSGYAPNEWNKSINLCGISDADIPTALENIENSADGTERGSFEITKANAIASVLNKKFKTTRGFKPKEWASAVDKLTALQVKNASGAIASFTDGADDVPIASASFSIVPYQNLNGYSKPWASGCGKNLFNKDDPHVVEGYISSTAFSTGNRNAKTVYIPIKSNTTYTVSKTAGQRFQVATAQAIPADSVPFTSRVSQSGSQASLTITSGANDTYLWAWIYLEGTDSGTLDAMLASIQIELGSSASSWEPYSNVCPITPYSQMTITHAKKNFYPISIGEDRFSNNGGASHNNDNGVLVINATTNNNCGVYINTNDALCSIRNVLKFFVDKNIAKTISFDVVATSDNVSLAVTSGTRTVYTIGTTPTRISHVSTGSNCSIYIQGADLGISCVVRVSNFQIEAGNVGTNYAPYSPPEVIGDNFGRSIYGGSRASDGTLTEAYLSVDLGSFTWIKVTNNVQAPYFSTTSALNPLYKYMNSNPNVKCSSYAYGSIGSSGTANGFYIIESSYIRIRDDIAENMTAEQFKTYITGVQLVYELATANEYDLDPLPEINSYYGDNNIFTDIVGGESSVNYRADIDLSQ